MKRTASSAGSNFSLLPALLSAAALILAAGLIGFSVTSASAADAGGLKKFVKSAEAAQDGAYTLTFQNFIRGKMQPEETIEVKYEKDGSIYAHWTGKAHKDRELIYRHGWNDGKAWIKEGGPLSFAAVSVDPGDDAIKTDYLHGIDFLSLKKIAEELGHWTDESDITESADGVLTIKKGGGESLQASFGKDGGLKKAVIKDATGKAVESYQIADLKLNTGLSAKDFDPANPAYHFPGYSKDGIFMDSAMLKTNLDKSYAGIKDYTANLVKRERIGGKMQEMQHIQMKYRKPLSLYMKWVEGPHKGREMIYRQGTDDKLIVHEGGMLNIATVHLALDSSLVKADTNHPITELDIGKVIDITYNNLSRGQKAGEAKHKFLGMKTIGGRKAYVIESWFPKGKGYYAWHTVNGHDIQTGLPIMTKSYLDDDQLLEEFTWNDFKTNVNFTDADFDPANKTYKF